MDVTFLFFHFFFYFKSIKVLELRNYILPPKKKKKNYETTVDIEALLLFKRKFYVILTKYSNLLLLFKRELYVILTKYSNLLKMQMTKILIAFRQFIYIIIGKVERKFNQISN